MAAFSGVIENNDPSCLLIPLEHVEAVRRYLARLLRGNLISLSPTEKAESTQAGLEPAVAGNLDAHLPRSIRLSLEERSEVARLIRPFRETPGLPNSSDNF